MTEAEREVRRRWGEAPPRLVEAMRAQADQVVNTYDFVNEWRPRLAQRWVEITPPNWDKAVILTTGAETTEAAPAEAAPPADAAAPAPAPADAPK